MTDIFVTRVKNLEFKEGKKNLLQVPKIASRKPRSRKRKTSTAVSLSLAKNLLKLAVQAKNTAFYTVYAIILRAVAKIYLLWSTSTNKKRRRISGTMERATRN